MNGQMKKLPKLYDFSINEINSFQKREYRDGKG